MKTVPLTEAKDRLSALVDDADTTHEIIQITRPGHFTSQRKVGLTVNSAPTKQSYAAHACPALRQVYGVGPDTAATLLVALGDNPERIGSDAAFAKLCGVSPIEASSGKTVRHRLNRGGNRDANRALHVICALSDSAATNPRATTSPAASPKAERNPKSCAA